MIKSAFEAEFPKLLKIILNFWEKVSQNNEGYQLMFFGKLKNSNVLEMFDLDLKNENSNNDYNAEEELRVVLELTPSGRPLIGRDCHVTWHQFENVSKKINF